MNTVSALDRYVGPTGQRLHLLDWGGNGPTILLSHAAGFLAALWWPVVRILQPDFHCIGLDLRGHGDSDPSPVGYGWPRFAEDVDRAVRELGIAPTLAVGHSVGGTATAMAAGADPTLFRAIVLIEPVIGPPAGHPRFDEAARASLRSADRAIKRRNQFESVEKFVEQYRDRPPFNAWPVETLEIYAREGTRPSADGGVELRCLGPIESQLYAERPNNDPWPFLPRIAAPTVVVRGKAGSDFPDFAEPASEVIPGCRLINVNEGGHLVPLECPERIAGIIREFFESL